VRKISDILREAAVGAIESGRETRYSLAKQCRLDYPSLARWLDEGRDIRLSTVDAIAEYLGLTLAPVSERGGGTSHESEPAAPRKKKSK
jgi:hypothetical protein